MSEDDICGVTCEDGTPCQNPAGDNGFCHISSHNPGDDNENSAGRKTKLTKERQEGIASMIEEGNSVAAACRCNGISQETFYTWLRKGDEQEEGIYSEFSDRITRARGEGERRLLQEAHDAALEKKDARTILSILRDRYPNSWGDEDMSDEGGTVNIHLEAPEPE